MKAFYWDTARLQMFGKCVFFKATNNQFFYMRKNKIEITSLCTFGARTSQTDIGRFYLLRNSFKLFSCISFVLHILPKVRSIFVLPCSCPFIGICQECLWGQCACRYTSTHAQTNSRTHNYTDTGQSSNLYYYIVFVGRRRENSLSN